MLSFWHPLQIYRQGLVSFGPQVYDPQTKGLTSDSNGYLIFPFLWNTQKPFQHPNAQPNVTVQEGSPSQMELAKVFIWNKTGNYSYHPHVLLLFQWPDMDFWDEVICPIVQ